MTAGPDTHIGHRIGAMAALALLLGCDARDTDGSLPLGQVAPCPAPALEDEALAHWLCVVGDREAMLDRGDLSAAISLGDLPDDPTLVAVGPIAGLRGEATIYDGTVIVTTMRGGKQVVLTGPDAAEAEAVFLAYGSADRWQVVSVPRPLDGLASVEAFVLEAAEAAGLATGPDAAFPFRLEGTPERLRYHVIFQDTEHGSVHGGHDRAAHKRSKIPFEADGLPVRIAGVLVGDRDVGRVTHPGRRTHLHAIVGEAEGAGHVDEIRLSEGMVLFLPRAPGG